MKSKIRIMKTRPEVTDEEIRGFMNFDTLLETRNEALKHTHRTIRYWLAGFTIIAIIAGVWLISKSIQEPESLKSEPGSLQSATKEPDPRPADSLSVKTEKQEQSAKVPEKSKLKNSKKQVTKENPKQAAKTPAESVYVLAEPVDGYPALYEYFSRELVYPPAALKDSIQGIVTVVFSINKDGKAEKIYIENSLSPFLDNEAIRLIENMPLWKPATYNNKPVMSKMSLPLTFQIEKVKPKE